MAAAGEKNSASRSEPLQGLESPFLERELFTEQGEDEWQGRLSALEAEGAFQSAFEQLWAQPEAGETENAEAFGDEFEFEEPGIIDGDNRVRVKDTTGVPWRWICKIDVADSRGRPAGSGTGVDAIHMAARRTGRGRRRLPAPRSTRRAPPCCTSPGSCRRRG